VSVGGSGHAGHPAQPFRKIILNGCRGLSWPRRVAGSRREEAGRERRTGDTLSFGHKVPERAGGCAEDRNR